MGISPAVVIYNANGDAVSVVNDSGTYRLSSLGKVQNAAGTTVNPATEDTLSLIDGVLDSIKDTDGIKKITDPLPAGTNNIGDVDVVSSALPSGAATETTLSTRATEATLLAADGRLTTIDSVLDSIKDTDGIKKITDQLPAGTNEIGAVAQGTRAAAAAGWPEYVVDSAGNVVGVVLDGSVYRLQADAKVAKGASALGHLEGIDVSTGVVRLKASMFTQAGDPVSFPSVSESIKNEFALNGSSSDLLVDGSTTPVVFEYLADSTNDISLQEMRFTAAANSITFGSDAFIGTAGPLTNGLLVEVLVESGTVTLYNLVQNESFVNFSSPGGFDWVVSSKDMMTSNYVIGGGLSLRAGTTDKVRVTVRDDLSSAGVYLRCFVKGNVAAD